MSDWQISYWHESSGASPVEKWLKQLPEEEGHSLTKELALLEQMGNELKLPHSRALKHDLFELRERHYNHRLYYTFLKNRIIVILSFGSKQNQSHDISVAYQRLEEVKRRQP